MKRATRRHLAVAKENNTPGRGRKRFRAALADFLRLIRKNHGPSKSRAVHLRIRGRLAA